MIKIKRNVKDIVLIPNFVKKINKNALKYQKRKPHVIIWRRILQRYLRAKCQIKISKTQEILDYSAEDLKIHIESLWTDGMSWDNYCRGGWVIDHIKPISLFPQDTHPSIVNALSNLRPMWDTSRWVNGVWYEGNLNKQNRDDSIRQ